MNDALRTSIPWAGWRRSALVFAALAVPGAAADTGGEPEREEGVVLAGSELEPQPPQEPPAYPADVVRPVAAAHPGRGGRPGCGGARPHRRPSGEVAARNGMGPENSRACSSPTRRPASTATACCSSSTRRRTRPHLSGPRAATRDGPFPYEDTFLLNSKPGSNRAVYLDFDGHTMTDTGWGAGNNTRRWP